MRTILRRILIWLIPMPDQYNIGWADGWNACRSAKPEDRIFIDVRKRSNL